MQAHRHRVGISQEGKEVSFLGVPGPGEEGTLEHQALAQTRSAGADDGHHCQGTQLRGSRKNTVSRKGLRILRSQRR